LQRTVNNQGCPIHIFRPASIQRAISAQVELPIRAIQSAEPGPLYPPQDEIVAIAPKAIVRDCINELIRPIDIWRNSILTVMDEIGSGKTRGWEHWGMVII
jgi:hypothetical protein